MTEPKRPHVADRAPEPKPDEGDASFQRRLIADERRLIVDEGRARDAKNYVAFHARRYDYVLSLAQTLAPDPATRVLDIGRSYLSEMLLAHYDSVTTLGFSHEVTEAQPDARSSARDNGRSFAGHIVFDLNDAQTTSVIDHPDSFDLIVFAEVIEHLYTAPEFVLYALKGLLAEDGLILCQTPNGAALHHRIKLMLGRNPYERIRYSRDHPGHFREYTRRELIEIGRIAGLATVRHEYKDYFGFLGSFAGRAAAVVMKSLALVMPSLVRGQTIVYRRD